jgi:predicted GNAT superfamily acetyltransferase
MNKLEKILKIKDKHFLLKVETSDRSQDYKKYDQLRNEIWGAPHDNLAGARNLMCNNFFNEGSGMFIGVYIEKGGRFKEDENHLIGFAYGYVGVKDKEVAYRSIDNLLFYSRYLGVKQAFQGYGLSLAIKRFQQNAVKNFLNIITITCMYDPLCGVNAYQNIHILGMDVLEYREGYLGEFGGFLYRKDVPYDRLYVSWDLEKKRQSPDVDIDSLLNSTHVVTETRRSMIEGKSGLEKIEILQGVNLELDQEFLLVEIPADFYRMLSESDVREKEIRDIPLSWRITIREVIKNLFQKNYRIIDFQQTVKDGHKRNFYILRKKIIPSE